MSEFEGITTDFNGYPIMTKAVRLEGFSDKIIVPTFSQLGNLPDQKQSKSESVMFYKSDRAKKLIE